MRRWTISAVAVVVLGVALAGCGGGGSKKSSAPATTQSTQTAASTTTSTPTTSGTPSFAASGRCKDLAASAQKFSSALTGAAGDLKKQAQIFQDFADQAPSDIRSDVKTIADAFSKLANSGVSLKPGQVPSGDQLAKLQAAIKQIDTAKVRQAEVRIEAWVRKNCTS
jgi:hypothetical protein